MAELFEDKGELKLGLIDVGLNIFLDVQVRGHFFPAFGFLILRDEFFDFFIDRLFFFCFQIYILFESVSNVFKLDFYHIDALHLRLKCCFGVCLLLFWRGK